VTDPRVIPGVDRASYAGVLLLWGFAAFWNGTLVFMMVAAWIVANVTHIALLAAASPFLLAGLFLTGMALTLTVRTIRYRSLVLRLDTLPGVVGGRVAGTISGAEGLLNDGMSVRLACWRRAVMSDSFDEVLWEDVEDVVPAGATVPFRFDVPFECLPASDDVYWQVSIRTRGRAVVGTFIVPVERTAQSSPEITEKSLRPRTMAQPPYSKLRLVRTAGGAIEVLFPRPGWLWKWWVFTLVVGMAGATLVREQFMNAPVGYAAVAVAVLFLVAIIELGVIFTPRLLRAGPDQLRMRFLSRLRPAKRMPSAEVADFVAKYDNGSRKYDVSVQRAGGASYPWLMISAADKREAEWLAYELRAALGR
jgi:hypothetical protein